MRFSIVLAERKGVVCFEVRGIAVISLFWLSQT